MGLDRGSMKTKAGPLYLKPDHLETAYPSFQGELGSPVGARVSSVLDDEDLE